MDLRLERKVQKHRACRERISRSRQCVGWTPRARSVRGKTVKQGPMRKKDLLWAKPS